MAASTAALLAALSGWKWNARGKAESSGIEGIQSTIQFLHLRWVKKNETKHMMMNFRYGYLSQSFHHMANSEPKITHLQQIPWRKGGRFSGWRFFQPGIVQGCQISCIPTFPVK